MASSSAARWVGRMLVPDAGNMLCLYGGLENAVRKGGKADK